MRGLLCLTLSLALTVNGCSLLIDKAARKKAVQRQQDADAVLKCGITRGTVIAKLGEPDEAMSANGLETDTYYLRSLPDPSSKSYHTWQMVDLEFLLLPELVMTPAVLYGSYFSDTDRKLCRVAYGSNQRITRSTCEDPP